MIEFGLVLIEQRYSVMDHREPQQNSLNSEKNAEEFRVLIIQFVGEFVG